MRNNIEITGAIRLKLLILLVLIFVSYSPIGYSNGWEHTSIDFEVLVKALNDANPGVRRRAAESMGFRAQSGATAALLARLDKNEPVERVRQQIYGALGRLGDTSAVPAIRSCLGNESSAALRSQCAAALGNIDSKAAQRLALRGVEDDNLQVRLNAIASLGSFSGEETVEALIELVNNDNDSIKNAAMLSLGRTRAGAAGGVLVDALEASTHRSRSILILQALTLLADPDTAEAIRLLYRQSDDESVKQYALVAMASTRARDSESYFLEALSSGDHASRVLGLAALRNLGSAGGVAIIARHALSDSGELFSRDSEQLLDEPASTIASLSLLNEYLKTIIRLDPVKGERLYLQATTPVTIPRSSSAALKIAEGFYTARWQSIYGLGYANTATAAERVALAMKDPDMRIRAVATRSMGVLGNREYLDLIEERLRDEAAEVRWTAARVLGRMKAMDSSDALMQSLDDDNTQVRLESVIALGYLNARLAKAELARLAASDPDLKVREAADYAASLIE
ncbi:MAG: HEAT repeat domain-containing protein [Gammaproteobacteria bacterium]|nr:HEAT repeat domain-containing protein [Gammaproteobacteria bacterium]